VIQRAVAAVGGQAFDQGVQHVLPGVAKGVEQANLIGHHLRACAVEEISGARAFEVRIELRLKPGALHVHQQQCGVVGDKRQVPWRAVGKAEHPYLSSSR
jgi:hypothetical protein